jgi:integrase
MHRGEYVDPASGKVRLSEVATGWSDNLVHLKVSTARRYRSILNHHVISAWGDWRLAEIRHSDVAAWVADLNAQGLRPGSVRQIHRILSLVLDSAVRDGRIAANAAKGVRLPRQVRSEPRFLSAEDVAALVKAAGDDGLPIAILAFTGLRFGELAALTVGHVDLRRCRLTVSRGVTEVGGQLVWSTPKTHQSRSVPFPRSLESAIRGAMAGRQPDEPLFTSPSGGVLRLNNWRHRIFDPACQRAGLIDVTPHDLRHTAASLAIRAGANVKAVQRMLGHASAAMTLDVYAGLFPDDLDQVAAALDSMVPTLVIQPGSTRPRRPQERPSRGLETLSPSPSL